MKKTFLNAALFLSMVATVSTTAISCSNSDDDSSQTVSSLDPSNFKGNIAAGTIVTLDASKVYTITGRVLVENGATLIIPEGTRITVAEGANYLIVDKGGKIFMNGTAAKPIVFEGTAHKQGHWGGIVILGNAPTNRTAAGTSTSELGDLTYGGTNTSDNSGVMKYVVIKDSGFK